MNQDAIYAYHCDMQEEADVELVKKAGTGSAADKLVNAILIVLALLLVVEGVYVWHQLYHRSAAQCRAAGDLPERDQFDALVCHPKQR